MVCVMNPCYANKEEDSHCDYKVGEYNRHLPGSQKTSQLSTFNSWQSQRCEQNIDMGKFHSTVIKLEPKLGMLVVKSQHLSKRAKL